jgi:putative flippase GtrA
MQKKKELLRAVKFTIFSISAGIIQILLFTLLNEIFNLDYWVSYLVALVASVLWNFTINRKVTFRSANNVKLSMLLVALFYAVFTPVSTVLGNLCEDRNVNEYVVLAATMIANFVLEYLFTRYVVYGKSCDTAPQRSRVKK